MLLFILLVIFCVKHGSKSLQAYSSRNANTALDDHNHCHRVMVVENSCMSHLLSIHSNIHVWLLVEVYMIWVIKSMWVCVWSFVCLSAIFSFSFSINDMTTRGPVLCSDWYKYFPCDMKYVIQVKCFVFCYNPVHIYPISTLLDSFLAVTVVNNPQGVHHT
jgi:hypothetical protein